MDQGPRTKKNIGITTGDPKGVGPEIVALALEDPEINALAEFRVFGPLESNQKLSDEEAAKTVLDSLNRATKAALDKEIAAMVTAPVNKARLRLVDKNFIGHTEFFAAWCNAPVCAMFVARNWRVSLVTGHLPLGQVAIKLNAMEILKTIRMTAEALQRHFHIMEPRLAVAGLNPHAGEQGMLGDEETRIIQPAIQQARKEGILMDGPLSADTLFWQMTQGRYDAVIAMYHDQGLIPIKTLAFKEAVQLTYGLPFLRVSVDHGTAEDLVGTGNADPSNLKSAIRLACQLI
ncbi:MAG: 4-hydroxythreonine-4-phosphate dehydrogenase PdxA [Deltaproteobacteria bacterium]|nr:4-hydroxythreonine-4-phosphate dehydrogenase PdxA [Deltaproteobacteria bacterium]